MIETNAAVLAEAARLFKAEGHTDTKWDDLASRNAGEETPLSLTNDQRDEYCKRARVKLGLPPLA